MSEELDRFSQRGMSSYLPVTLNSNQVVTVMLDSYRSSCC